MASMRMAVAITALTGSVAWGQALPFEIQNGRGAAGLAFTAQLSASGAWSRTIRIVTSEPRPTTEALRIVEPIVVETDAGESVSLRPKTQPENQALAPDGAIPIELGGVFTTPGIYRGELLLVQPPKQRVVPIQVTVTAATPAPPPSILDHGARSIAVTESLGGSAATLLSIRLENTGSAPVAIVPVLAGIARVDKLDNPSYQLAVETAAVTGAAKTIKPNDLESFDVPLTGINEPGIYSVEIQFRDAAAKHQPYSVKATVYRRQSGWWAAAAIAIGALLAWFVRAYVSDGKGRLALRRRLALLVEQVRAIRATARNEEVIAASRVFELDIDDRQRDARSGGKLDDLEQISSRAEARLALLREITAALLQLERIDTDKQPPARKVLDAALAVVRIDPGDPEQIKTQRHAVAQLALDGVRRDQLMACVTELTRQIEAQNRVASATLTSALRAAGTLLEAAGALANQGKLDELERLVDRARLAVVDACLAELWGLAAGTAPLGVSTSSWNHTTTKITAHIEDARRQNVWTKRNAALRSAQKIYFTAAVTGLVAEANRIADAGDVRADKLRAIAAELTTALDKDVDEAAARYPDALAIVSAPPAAVSKGPVSFGTDDLATAITGWLPLLISRVMDSGEPAPLSEPSKLDRTIKSYGYIVSMAVLGIAVASGLKALWIDNLAWGGHSALLNALLWGAGVQATGDAFTGLIGLRAKLGAPPPT